MPRTSEQNQKLKEAARWKILFAALEEFARKGLSVRISEIAERAGISQGLLYHYFHSKEELIVELLKMAGVSSSVAVHQTLQGSEDIREKVRALTHMMLDVLRRDDITALFFMFVVQTSIGNVRNPAIDDALKSMGGPVEDMFHLVCEGQAQGVMVDGDPQKLAVLYWQTITGLCCYKLSGCGIMPDEAMINRIVLK